MVTPIGAKEPGSVQTRAEQSPIQSQDNSSNPATLVQVFPEPSHISTRLSKASTPVSLALPGIAPQGQENPKLVSTTTPSSKPKLPSAEVKRIIELADSARTIEAKEEILKAYISSHVSELTVEEIILLVEQSIMLYLRMDILKFYVSHHAFDLSAADVVRLAGSHNNNDFWSEDERAYHDDLLAHYVKERDYQLSPEEAVVVAKANRNTGNFDESIENYVFHHSRNPELSFEHVIDLVANVRSLGTKAFSLQGYVGERGANLSAEAAIALAREANQRGKWLDAEKKFHDRILALWVAIRLSTGPLPLEEILKAAEAAFSVTTSEKMLLDYVRVEKPSLDEYAPLAALAKHAATTRKIKAGILEEHVRARAAELSAEAVIDLAEQMRFPRGWWDSEQSDHDQILGTWFRLRLDANTLSLSDLLKVAGKTFGVAPSAWMLSEYVRSQDPSREERFQILILWVQIRQEADVLNLETDLEHAEEIFEVEVSDQMLLDYLRDQNLSVDQRRHLAALAKSPAVAKKILGN